MSQEKPPLRTESQPSSRDSRPDSRDSRADSRDSHMNQHSGLERLNQNRGHPNSEPMNHTNVNQNREQVNQNKGQERRGLRPAAFSLASIVRSSPFSNRMVLADLRHHWDRIVPSHWKGYLWPRRLTSRHGTSAILHIEVKGPVGVEIRHEEESLITVINRHIGRDWIGTLRYYRVYHFSKEPS